MHEEPQEKAPSDWLTDTIKSVLIGQFVNDEE